MVEEIKKDEQVSTESTSETNIAEQAFKAAAELRAANEVKKQLLDREEKLIAMRQLGGRAEAGLAPKVESDEERIKRQARSLLAGTGLDPFK